MIMELNRQIQETLQGLRLPAEVLETVGKALGVLEAEGVAPGIAVGEKAPGFRLPDARGREVSLEERLERGPVVLSFYRGAWCPFCNLELKALQEILPRIQEVGASLMAVSPQTPARALSLAEAHGLGFDLLSDATQKAIREYRLQFTVPQEIREIYMRMFGLDVARENADGSWNLPVPATFVIDTAGMVRAHHVAMDYMTRMEPHAIVAALTAIA